ncbi:MAG: AraC family transcriptional regulator [Nitrospiraceae bacterium]|nr:AraC family transcriptional regulator [Nitrospiraceae bacterium]
MNPISSVNSQNLVPISTILTSEERLRVDAAGQGLYHAIHRDSVEDVLRDLKGRTINAVLVSVTKCQLREAPRVARLVKEFPNVPAVALLTDIQSSTPQTVLTLGQCGIRTLVDVRQPSGWRDLRNFLLADRSHGIQKQAVALLAQDLGNAPEDCQRFFLSLFLCSTRTSTVLMLSRALDVLPSTLMSRFFRARLPAPKRYLALSRLVRAANLFENSGLSVANVANQLDYSSPQSFGRHIRTLLQVTAVEFRERYTGAGMLQRFREELITPYLSVLQKFSPLIVPPGWVPPEKTDGRLH